MQIHMTAAELRRLFAPVLPFAGTDDMLPVLTAIQLTVKDGYLVAAATDRFRLAINRVRPGIAIHKDTGAVQAWDFRRDPQPGDIRHDAAHRKGEDATDWQRVVLPAELDVMLPAAQCRRILALFKTPRRAVDQPVVTLDVDVSMKTCTVSGGRDLSGEASLAMSFELTGGTFPKIQGLIAEQLDTPVADRTHEVGLNPKFLAAFATACVEHGEQVVGLQLGKYGKPLIGFVGEDFVGLVMPRRLLDADLSAPAPVLGKESKAWSEFLSK